MKNYFFIFLSIMTFTVFAQDSETRSLSPFYSLTVNGGIDVVLVPSNENKVVIETRTTTTDNINTNVKGGKLKIDWTGAVVKIKKDEDRAQVTLYYNELYEIDASASAYVEGESEIEAETMKIGADAGGEVDLEIETEKLDMSARAGGIITLRGSAKFTEAVANSGGEIDAYRLQTSIAEIKSNTGASVSISVEDRLKARASTGGNIEYSGDPDNLDTKSNLGGNISRG